MYHKVALVLSLISIAATLEAQDKSATEPSRDAPSVAKALEVAARLLVESQENYQRDPRVGRLRDVEVWQKTERVRLAKLRKANAPGVEWPYEGVYRVRGIVPPGYRVGGSAIVCEALVRSPGFASDASRQAAVRRSIEFMLDELKNNTLLGPGPKQGYDVRGWAHCYGLQFLLLVQQRKLVDDKVDARITEMVAHLIKCLATNEASGGGWNYANNRCSPFMTGSTLLALYQARAQGYRFDRKMVERALDALAKARTKTGSYVYAGVIRPPREGRSGRRRRDPAAMPGACARAAISELCLFQAGRSDATRLRVAVDAFFEHWGELLKRKSQQGTHQGPYNIAPYYFMYGHTYAAMAIEALPEDARPALREKMHETLWRTREQDGGWNDRIFPRSKSYSTAMAMLALLAPHTECPSWTQSKDK